MNARPRIKLVVVAQRDIKRFAKRFGMTVTELLAWYRQQGGLRNDAGDLLMWCEESDG